jgi:serine-type D-Ala-D-Ala carboxypeptidase/endopeptidase (penicillin-binding protein 4)
MTIFAQRGFTAGQPGREKLHCDRRPDISPGMFPMRTFFLFALTWHLALAGPIRYADAKPMGSVPLQETLDSILDHHASGRRTTVQLKVLDLESGQVLYDRGGDRLMTPASNLKLYTSACALDLFGPDHRFPTRLVATGPVSSGLLRGNLVLVGGGNAMLSADDLMQLVDQVATDWGIRQIAGDVIVDNSRYASPTLGPGWMWDDEPATYNMPVTPLMVDFNVLAVRLVPRSDQSVAAALIPPASYPSIRHQSDSGEKNGNGPSSVRVTRAPFTDTIIVKTAGPLEHPVDQRLTMHDPSRWVAALVRRMLTDHGVKFGTEAPGSKPLRTTPGKTDRQLVIDGPPLAETIRHFNHVSENGVGEVLLHEVAILRGKKQPTWADGAQCITDWLIQTAGLEPGSFRLVDGSGLSRYNLISADSSVRLLAMMQKEKHFDHYFHSLKAYAVDCAAIEWQAATPGDQQTSVEAVPWGQSNGASTRGERVRAKPGGMTGVSTISGYLQTLDGRTLAFSLLANGILGSKEQVLDLRATLWQTLVQYRPEQ